MPRCVDWPPPPTHFVLIELRVDAVDAFVAAKHVREARGRRGLDVARAELHLASDAHRERLTHAVRLEANRRLSVRVLVEERRGRHCNRILARIDVLRAFRECERIRGARRLHRPEQTSA